MKTLIMLFVAVLPLGGFSQKQNHPTTLAQLVAQLDEAASVADYESMEHQFSVLAQTEDNWLAPYYAALCNARIGFLLERDGERIEPYSDRGIDQLKQALAVLDTATQHHELAEVYTVASLLYRTKVFVNPMTMGAKYGPLSERYLQRALQLNPNNPRAIYVNAWNKYHTPKTWGGDKELAKILAQKSLSILANEPKDVQPHWGTKENEKLLND